MHLRHRRLSDDTRAEREAEADLLKRQASYYNSTPYMPKQDRITISAHGPDGESLGTPVTTTIDGIAKLAERMSKRGKQSTFEDPSFEPPKPIQAVNDALDDLFDFEAHLKSLKVQRDQKKLLIMGLLRAAGRTMYRYRGATISIEEQESKRA